MRMDNDIADNRDGVHSVNTDVDRAWTKKAVILGAVARRSCLYHIQVPIRISHGVDLAH